MKLFQTIPKEILDQVRATWVEVNRERTARNAHQVITQEDIDKSIATRRSVGVPVIEEDWWKYAKQDQYPL